MLFVPPRDDKTPPLSVAQFVAQIQTSVRGIKRARIEGDIGRVNCRNGHSYFELADASAKVNCIAWAGSCVDVPSSGGRFVADVQRLDFYARHGTLSAHVSALERVEAEARRGVELRQLTEQLRGEGVLTRPRLVLPEIPTQVRLITAAGSGGAQDMLEGVQRRWPGLRVTLIDTSVQGDDAPRRIAAAFDVAAALLPPPDVVVCGRGGGSDADLDCFNDERVARAFLCDRIPTVSAVGHETAHPIADLVADVRAKTPTDAIVRVLHHTRADCEDALRRLRAALDDARSRTCERLGARLGGDREVVTRVARACVEREVRRLQRAREALQATLRHRMSTARQTPARLRAALAAALRASTAARAGALRGLAAQLDARTASALQLASSRLAAQRRALDAFSAAPTMHRGFALLQRRDEQGGVATLRDLTSVTPGETLRVRMRDGFIDVVVK